MDILILLALFLLNGLFAMAEIALVAARRVRLEQAARAWKSGARVALELATSPGLFLATVQVGITSIGILSGAFGEAALTGELAAWLAEQPELAPFSRGLASVVVVIGLTLGSLILGELVPKRLGLHRPEQIAVAVAWPMRILSLLAYPVVKLLSLSSDLILKLLGSRPGDEPMITEQEIKALLQQGTQAGVFLKTEQEMVANVLRLDALPVGAVMTPRPEIYFLDIEDSVEENRRKMIESPHSVLPVCKNDLDNVLGFVQAKDLLRRALDGQPMALIDALRPAQYVPKSLNPTQLLEEFKRMKSDVALVVDEYGDVVGLVTLQDIMEAIVGDIPSTEADSEPEIVEREDGSWLVDGMLSIEKFKQLFEIDQLPDEGPDTFHTLAGFVMLQLGHVPRPADFFFWNGFRFEVVDMDRNRVDKILIVRAEPAAASAVGDRT